MTDACPRCGRPAGAHDRPCTITTTWPTTALDAEPGTPDDRERLRRAIALALARADRTGALGEPEDRWHEYTAEADAVLAVRDDALTTALERARKAERAADLLADAHRHAEAAEQRITAALAECDAIDRDRARLDTDGESFGDGMADAATRIRIALTGGTKDGGAA